MSYTVAQNTVFLTASSVLQKIISFGYFVLIARLVGVENTGQYFFAIAFTTIFTVVADFGLSPVLTRELSRLPNDTGRYINTVITTKLILGIVAYILAVLSAYFLGYSPDLRLLISLAGVTMFFDNLHSSFYSVLRARRNLMFEAIGTVAAQFITMVIGTLSLFLKWPLYWLILAYTIPSFLNVIFSSYLVKKLYQVKYALVWDKVQIKVLFLLSWPFAMSGIIGRLYAYSDSLLMSKLLSAKEMGWWSVPYKIVFAFQFVPSALAASVYPVFSAMHTGEREKIGPLFTKSWRYLFVLVFPLALGLGVLAEPAIRLVYGPSYLPSVPVLQILLVSLVFSYLSFITGSLINATNHQRTQSFILLMALIFNVALNLYTIPKFGIVGAATTALLSNILIVGAGYYFCSRYIKLDHVAAVRGAFWTLVAAILMAVVVYVVNKFSNIFVAIPVGIFIYLILIFAMGIISKDILGKMLDKVKPIFRKKI